MAKRRKVALIYEYNENWIGGTYYIQNLVSALGTLPNEQQPNLVIFAPDKTQFDALANTTGYRRMSYRKLEHEHSFSERIINKLSRLTINRNVISGGHKDIDILFPASAEHYFYNAKHFLYWIPDFQEHHLPEFFSAKEIIDRREYQDNVVATAHNIVFSSETANKDFNLIYPDNKLKKYLLRFAVTHPNLKTNSLKDTLIKFGIKKPYFICSNQFWKHKNHSVVLQALKILSDRGIVATVIFTGKEHDHRNPTYFEEVATLASSLEIKQNISFLGFIEREEQLTLMKNALAVIQPSFFEGWSTVVEDAKALNVMLLASDIEVHREQLHNYKMKKFFEASNADVLASCMNFVLNSNSNQYDSYVYEVEIHNFAHEFISIIEKVVLNQSQ